jgi:hypothetical protein
VSLSHGKWASILAGQPLQKTFRIVQTGDVQELLLTIFESQSNTEDKASAQVQGWGVSAGLRAAPNEKMFEKIFVTEREARGVFDDLADAASKVEGLVRQEKLKEAEAATAELIKKFSANSSDTPITTAQTA